MPSYTHEALIELFHRRPSLAAELLAGALDVPVPGYRQARLESGDLVLLSDDDGPVLAVIVEVQLRRDPGKRWSWPVYLATLRARLHCPAVLLVLCPDNAAANWCAAPIAMGHPGWELRPLVLGPGRVPVVTDTEQATQSPELAVLSAMAHGAHSDDDKVLHALLAGLREVDDDHANLYTDLVLTALPEAARARMEELMTSGTYEYQSDFARRYYGEGRAQGEAEGRAEGEAEGRAEGEAHALLGVLAAREIAVPEDARTRITSCSDLQQLHAWVRRAVTINTIDELFS